MINIEFFRGHNNDGDEARIILTGSSGSVLPPVALWVAQSYRLTPGQGGLEGDVLNTSVSPGVSFGPQSGGAWTAPGRLPVSEVFCGPSSQEFHLVWVF